MFKIDEIQWDLVPNYSLGPIKIASPVKEYIEQFELVLDDTDQEDKSMCYDAPDDNLSVFAELGLVTDILKYSTVHFKGKEIIGMSSVDLFEYLEQQPSEITDNIEYSDGSICYYCQFDELGVLIGIDDSTDKVVSVMCSDLR